MAMTLVHGRVEHDIIACAWGLLAAFCTLREGLP